MRRTAFRLLASVIVISGCQQADPTRQILLESARAVAAVTNGTYGYEYEGSGSLTGSYAGQVAFENASSGAFYFKAEISPSPTPPLPGHETTTWGLPKLTIASNGHELTARDEATGRFSYGTYAGGAGHLAASSGYAVLFEFAESEPFRNELAGELTDLGREVINGVETYVIGATSPSFGGAEVTWYIGVEDGLPRGRDWRATRPGSEGTFSFRISGLTVDAALDLQALGNKSEIDDELIDEDARVVAVGATAPNWTLTTGSGEDLSTGDLRGQVTVLAIWSTWCAQCLEYMSAIDSVAREFEGQPIRLLGVAAWEDPAADPVAVMASRSPSFEVLEGGELLAIDHKVAAPPALFVVDPEGRLVMVRNPITATPTTLARDLETAIRGVLP